LGLNKLFWGAVSWTVFIAVTCLISSGSFSSFKRFKIPYKDKAVHFVFYFVLVMLWAAYLNRPYRDKRKLWLFVFFAAVLYGIFIEVCQWLFTKSRSADIADIFANTAGAATAVLALWLLKKNKS